MLGSSLAVFIGFTILLMGLVAFMTGQALASTWRPLWQVVPYTVVLGLVDRFFIYALFAGDFLSITGLIVNVLWFMGIGIISYRVTLARRMTVQYPWLYTRNGLLGWQERKH